MNIRRLALALVFVLAACGKDKCCTIEDQSFDTGDCEKCVNAGGSCHTGRCGSGGFANDILGAIPKTVTIEIKNVGGDRNQFTLSGDGNVLKFSGWGTIAQAEGTTTMRMNFGVDKQEWDSVIGTITSVLPLVTHPKAFANEIIGNIPKTVDLEIVDVGHDGTGDNTHYRFALSDKNGNVLKFSGWGTITQSDGTTRMKLNFGVANPDEWTSVVMAVSDLMPLIQNAIGK